MLRPAFVYGIAIIGLLGILMLCLLYSEGFIDFMDENNNRIDVDTTEKEEQDQANEYIQSDDCVLELGARYGTVSVVINRKLQNPSDHVVVEPDEDVWAALENNKLNANSSFHILKGIISNKKMSLEKGGYGTSQVEDQNSALPHFTLQEASDLVSKPFTVLVADCEGCLFQFLSENKELLTSLRLILMEEDMPHKCDYAAVKQILQEHSFQETKPGFHSVWTR